MRREAPLPWMLFAALPPWTAVYAHAAAIDEAAKWFEMAGNLSTPEDARKMILHDPIYAAYMPCRIALVEDSDGRLWLMMLNLDMLINSNLLPPELTEIAIRVNQAMRDLMVAGATGEF